MTLRHPITIARTPLFAALRRALHAAPLHAPDQPAALNRRDFLKRSVTGAALLSLGAPLLASCSRGAPRIVIIGAGIAGLNAAYVLKKSSIDATVYDANDRTGGRILTARDAAGGGFYAEQGGEFIDAKHADMLGLAKEFGLEVLDRNTPELAGFQAAYFFGGQHYSEAQLIEALKPLREPLAADAQAIGNDISYATANAAAQRLDALSLSAYLDRLGTRGWLREVLEVAHVTEFGLDADQQSALNMVTTLGAMQHPAPVGRERRYVIKGGNDQIIQVLAQRLESQLRLRYRFEMIKQHGDGYRVLFRDGNSVAKEERADVVIFALPFSLLREATIDVPLSDVKRKAIEALGYGTSSKLLVGFNQRVWRTGHHNGELFTDEPLQTAWDHSVLQSGTGAGMTFMLGGRRGVEVGHDSPEHQVNRLIVGMERAFPAARDARGGKIARFHWPTHPHSKGSTACYTVGQWTSIAGAEAQPAGKIFFAGEHCSREFRGSMNGAAETGRRAAQSVLTLLTSSRVG
ncbi:MAG: FAD-dependent oxidoreductase [Gammaproteobacteria bacterium]|nr:FAD-dependent oxidoreductase [Gammaproteobacteria bacterium]